MSGTCQVELGDASYSRVAMVGSTLGSRTTNGNPADVLFVKLRSATTKREDGKDDLIVYVCLPKLASGSHVFPASSALFGKGGEVGPVNGHGLFVASSKGRAVAFLATRGSRVELRIEDTSTERSRTLHVVMTFAADVVVARVTKKLEGSVDAKQTIPNLRRPVRP